MKIPFNNLQRFYANHAKEFDNIITNTVKSGWWLAGQQVTSFSNKFANYIDVKHVKAVANGTDALEIALRALDISVGDEVMTVANAGGFATTACRLIGATPVYVDISDTDLLIDLNKITPLISEKTKVIVVTHLYGSMVDVTKLRDVLQASGNSHISIIEDCAQVHGAKLHGKMAGSFGDIATFSFYPSKNLGAFGDAGAIATNNIQLADKVASISQYGWSKQRYDVAHAFGRNSRMDEIQAAILSTRMQYLDAQNTRRRQIIMEYQQHLPAGYRIIGKNNASFVGHLAILICPQGSRAQVQRKLTDAQIGHAVHYPILDSQQSVWQQLPHRLGNLCISETINPNIISLPNFPEMTDVEVEYVVNYLKKL